MTPFLSEFLGTFVLLFLGIGVVANVSLQNTIASGSSATGKWILITTAWGFAVFFGVIVSGEYSGGHLNPAVTVGLAAANKFAWSQVPAYILAQFLGAMAGAIMAYIFYRDHIKLTHDEGVIKGCFSTGPAIRNTTNNFISECIGTFMLVFLIFFIASPFLEIDGVEQVQYGIGSMDAFPVGVLVWLIGMALGGTTGYAINPARDLGPRIIYSLFRGKKAKPDWSYAWIPMFAPLVGGFIAGILYTNFF
jgi:glycerol uptake facilitator protein